MAALSHIRVIILAGGRDFGRDLLAADLPTALWLVAGRAVLEPLLVSFPRQRPEDGPGGS